MLYPFLLFKSKILHKLFIYSCLHPTNTEHVLCQELLKAWVTVAKCSALKGISVWWRQLALRSFAKMSCSYQTHSPRPQSLRLLAHWLFLPLFQLATVFYCRELTFLGKVLPHFRKMLTASSHRMRNTKGCPSHNLGQP